MNDLVNTKSELTMSSREIATLVEKRHDNVCRDIRSMLCALHGGHDEDYVRNSNLSYVTNHGVTCIQYDTTNPNAWEYRLDKDNTICLVSGYNAQLRMKIIKRWQELESRVNTPALPQNYIQALEALLESEKEKERLALENKEMTPKADVYDRIVERNGLYNATQIAQKFGQSAIWLNKQLASMDVYNRSVKRGRVFQQWFIDKGYGIMRETENGFSQPMFYAEGEMWIVRKLSEEGLI
ncbi:hypothetical protein RCIP0068_00028 [Klebsiella phage RCIP0068]